MNNEEFLRGKAVYGRLSNEKKELEEKRDQRLLEIETRMSMLEEDDKVKEYIYLQREKENIGNDKLFGRLNMLTDAQNVSQAFDYTCRNTKDSNKIYVFMGYEKIDNSINVYRDLETLEFIRINIPERYKFEKENKVIYPNLLDKKYFFELLRAYFLRYLSSYSQEESVEKILKLGKVGFKPRI